MKKFLFIMLSVSVVAFCSCKKDSKKEEAKKDDSKSEVTVTGGSMTYNGETFELTTAVQHNYGKTYQQQTIPTNYIEVALHKIVKIDYEGQSYYDTLHFISIGLFCNGETLEAGTYVKNTNADPQTYLNTKGIAGYFFGHEGVPARDQIFQKTGVYTGDVVVKKEGDIYTITINWTDNENKSLTATWTGAIPSGTIPTL